MKEGKVFCPLKSDWAGSLTEILRSSSAWRSYTSRELTCTRKSDRSSKNIDKVDSNRRKALHTLPIFETGEENLGFNPSAHMKMFLLTNIHCPKTKQNNNKKTKQEALNLE